jgi:hypothetical protein
MTNPIDPNLSPVRRDALVRAHRAGHRYPALWNDWLRAPLIAAGLLEEDGVDWRLTDAGVELAARVAEGRG